MFNSEDFLYFMIALLFMKPTTTYERLGITMADMSTKEVFEKVICDRIQNPDTSAEDIRTLSEAYANLHKDEWIKGLYGFNGYGMGFGGPTAQLANVAMNPTSSDEKG